MLSRKIERIGDQAKNILDLALEGVDLRGDPDLVTLQGHWSEVTDAFAGAQAFLGGDRSEQDYLAYRARGGDLYRRLEAELRQLIHSDLPAQRAVPRALLARYLKRIVANLTGIAASLIDPFDQIEFPDPDEAD